jgi:hypothetical protein
VSVSLLYHEKSISSYLWERLSSRDVRARHTVCHFVADSMAARNVSQIHSPFTLIPAEDAVSQTR